MQAIQASQFEDLFEEHLRLYDSDRDMVAQDQHDQDQIAVQVREANREFTRANKGDSSTKDREKALQELENGYIKYKEIISNLEVGRKFYNDLARIVGRFRDDCKAFVHQRRMEASQIEAYVHLSLRLLFLLTQDSEISSVAAMASLNISQSHLRPQPQPTDQHPRYNPAQNVPIQQLPAQVQPEPVHSPRPSVTREPLTAPQPTRANVAPPQVPTPGMWSPEMGIRFAGAGPSPPAQPGQWDPSKGVRFS